MKNYEKYADDIRKLKSDIEVEWCELFAKPKVLKPLGRKCENVSCRLCNALATLWLLEDYKEPEVDWSKVEVDTPILVRNCEDEEWVRRYFAEYKYGVVYAWTCGKTSWTEDCATGWNYVKLAESEDE